MYVTFFLFCPPLKYVELTSNKLLLEKIVMSLLKIINFNFLVAVADITTHITVII